MADPGKAIENLRKIVNHGEPYDYIALMAIETIEQIGQEIAKLKWLEAQFEARQRDKVSRGT